MASASDHITKSVASKLITIIGKLNIGASSELVDLNSTEYIQMKKPKKKRKWEGSFGKGDEAISKDAG